MGRIRSDRFLSVKIVRLLMKFVGFWNPKSEREQKILNIIQIYTVVAILNALWVEACDFYLNMDNFYSITYTACSTMPVITVLVKVITFMHHRKKVLRIIKFTEDNFWYSDYDEFGTNVLMEAEKIGLVLVCMFTSCVQLTSITYMLAPIIENIGKNKSDRVLPFDVWFGCPIEMSPYFEIAFALEISGTIQTGLAFCCFDNFLGLLNIHVAAQFKILGHRLQTLFAKVYENSAKGDVDREINEEFKKCVRQHRMLISYVVDLETVFKYANLCQMLISSVMLCVAGFQVFTSTGTFLRRLTFIAHTNGTFFQLFVTTLTANMVIVESGAIGLAAYNSDWQASMKKTNKDIGSGIRMMILRSSKPCCITAGGFFPVSIDTFMTVLSTSVSYFTLLRKFDGDLSEQ